MARWIEPTKRYALYARTAHHLGEEIPCGWCSEPCNGYLGSRSITLDHLVPRAESIRAGNRPDNRATNLFVACEYCNSARGDMPAAEFAATSWRVKRGWRERIDAQVSAPISAEDRALGAKLLRKYGGRCE